MFLTDKTLAPKHTGWACGGSYSAEDPVVDAHLVEREHGHGHAEEVGVVREHAERVVRRALRGHVAVGLVARPHARDPFSEEHLPQPLDGPDRQREL